MKVSKHWLQKFFDVPLPATDVLADGLMFHAFEVEEVEKVGDDDVIDLKVLQRGHDCLSHRGVAKEISAIFNLPLVHDPFTEKPNLSQVTDSVSVSIENPDLCPRYIAGYIKNVQVKESPQWLREQLVAIGQKPINNIVDATNFVMFNIGQPLHAFDANKIHGGIAIRHFRKGEQLDLLRTTKEIKGGSTAEWARQLVHLEEIGALIIADDNGPLALAGVKGGQESAIDQNTTSIIIESANFDGVAVRRASKIFNLRTDASVRFEEVISPELAAYGMQGVVELILKIAGGELVGYVDVYSTPQKPRNVSVTLEQVQKLLGPTFGEKEIIEALTRLGFSFVQSNERPRRSFIVEIPFERLDIVIPEDLVEEVGRIIGYDKIEPKRLPALTRKPAVNTNFYAAEKKREELIAQGYSEIYTSVFADKGERVVLNKVDGTKPYLRTNLTDGLREAYEKNKRNAEFLGLKKVMLFEIGTVWKDGEEKTMVGIADEKGVREEQLEIPKNTPDEYEDMPLSQTIRYVPFSKYPFIIRDVAMWVPEEMRELSAVSFSGIIDSAIVGSNLSIGINFLDRFQKGERISYAFRMTFQSFDRTLTEEEINPIMGKIYGVLKEKGFEIR